MPNVQFYPQPKEISAITRAANAQVTTTTAHGFNDGQVVRLYVPLSYGMQINGKQFTITVIDDTNFTIGFDTRMLDAFVVPAQTFVYPQVAQAIAVSGQGQNLASQSGGNI